MEASLNWIKDMSFSCENHGFKTSIDALESHGGSGLAPTPKELVLNAMMGCTAMDVVSMLKKMRQEIGQFKMKINAEKSEGYPSYFKTAELIFDLSGPIDHDKLIKSVDASLTKYCGVNYMISKTCAITFKVYLNSELIKEGPVKFIEPN